MGTPPRLVPLLDQYAFARERLAARLNGPVMDSGNGTEVKVDGPLADAEYFWEPVAAVSPYASAMPARDPGRRNWRAGATGGGTRRPNSPANARRSPPFPGGSAISPRC